MESKRFNRTIEDMLSKFVQIKETGVNTYHCCYLHTGLRYTREHNTDPIHDVLWSSHPSPVDLLCCPPCTETKMSSNENVLELQERLRKVQSIARTIMNKASDRTKENL